MMVQNLTHCTPAATHMGHNNLARVHLITSLSCITVVSEHFNAGHVVTAFGASTTTVVRLMVYAVASAIKGTFRAYFGGLGYCINYQAYFHSHADVKCNDDIAHIKVLQNHCKTLL